MVDTLGLVQLDSVNVFSRAHYMPFFSRLGPYDRDGLDDWLWRSGEMFEYWGHEASLIPMTQHPLWRWRTKAAWRWHRLDEIMKHQPDYFDRVLDEVRVNGPLQARDLTDPGNRNAGEMWGWSKGKIALEYLFLKGEVSVADRVNFTRMYAVTPDVIPEEVLALPALGRDQGQEALVEAAARSMGVATLTDLADYPRLRVPDTRPVVDRLVESGRLEPVEVDGWDSPAFLHPAARLPRAVEGRALLRLPGVKGITGFVGGEPVTIAPETQIELPSGTTEVLLVLEAGVFSGTSLAVELDDVDGSAARAEPVR